MKPQIGIINNYNGYTGKILSETGEYLLTDKNTKEALKENDKVTFIPEEIKDIKIARFVKKLENKNKG